MVIRATLPITESISVAFGLSQIKLRGSSEAALQPTL